MAAERPRAHVAPRRHGRACRPQVGCFRLAASFSCCESREHPTFDAIHVFDPTERLQTWMPGTRPGMMTLMARDSAGLDGDAEAEQRQDEQQPADGRGDLQDRI